MDYEERQVHPGDPVSSGADIYKALGYTDTRNPYISFHHMNTRNKHERMKYCIDNGKPLSPEYNSEIILLRDFRLGTRINEFINMCECELSMYEDSWREYRADFNPSMPEEFYEFWYFSEELIRTKILPNYINLIDPITMKWMDMQYSKITCKDGIYQYKLEKPIMTSDARFLNPDIEIEYENHKPDYEVGAICEELTQDLIEHLPDWLMKVDHMNHDLEIPEPEESETQNERNRATKFRIRQWFRRSKRQ